MTISIPGLELSDEDREHVLGVNMPIGAAASRAAVHEYFNAATYVDQSPMYAEAAFNTALVILYARIDDGTITSPEDWDIDTEGLVSLRKEYSRLGY